MEQLRHARESAARASERDERERAAAMAAGAAAGQAASARDRDEEEAMMMEESQTAGQHDHRTAMEVAMELLEQELGARRA